MSQPQRIVTDPLVALADSVSSAVQGVDELRTAAALTGLPPSRLRTVIEEAGDGTLRVGLTNLATGTTAWLTPFF